MYKNIYSQNIILGVSSEPANSMLSIYFDIQIKAKKYK